MFIRKYINFDSSGIWPKISTISLILFFVLMGDAILSYWVPNLVQDTLKSPLAMGFIVSFSSLVRIGIDLVFPQALKGISVKKLLYLSSFLGLIFAISLYESFYFAKISFFLFSMVVWGFFYELLGFAQQQFVADTIPLKERSGVWGIIRVFRDLAYFLGPLLAGWLILRGEVYLSFVAVFFIVISLIIIKFSGRTHERKTEIVLSEVNLIKEFSIWKILFKRVWPVVVLSILISVCDSVFWTTGAVWSNKLARESFWGGLFLPLYMLPTIFSGFVIAKLQIFSGKKKLAMKLFAGFCFGLMLLWISDNIFWQLFVVLLASSILAFVYPLVDGVYTDIIARMGYQRKHMIGLSNSTRGVGFILGPILAGLTAGLYGEKLTFVLMGALCLLITLLLFIKTPKKLKVPQSEIKSWNR